MGINEMPSKDGQRKMKLWRIAAYIAACIALATLVTRPTESYDIWFHIATGRWIAFNGRIPTKDTFSQNATRKWQPHSWLFDLLSFHLSGHPSTLPSHEGIRNLLIAKGLLCGAAFVILMDCAFRLCGNQTISFLLSLLAIYASLPSLDIRPYVVTVFLFIFCLRLLLLIGENASWRKVTTNLLWLFFCSVVWANTHGGFLIGIVASLTFAFATLIIKTGELAHRLRQGCVGLPKPSVYMIATLVMLLGSLCNPFGVHALTYPFTYWLTETRYALSIVTEWLPPSFKLPYDYAFLMLLCLCILLPTAIPLSSSAQANARRNSLALAILCAMTAAMALISRRNICLFATCSVPFIAMMLSNACQSGILSKSPAFNWHSIILMSAVLVAILSRQALTALHHPVRNELFPYDAVEFMKANSLPTRIFNPYGWGGFLMAAFDGRVKVFIDGRADIYSAQFLRRYYDAENGSHGWDEFLDEHGVETALVDVATPLYELLRMSTKWHMLYRDITGAVFVRVLNKTMHLIERAERDELKYPKNAWASFYRGMMCAERGQYERAILHWKEALSLKPDLAEAATNLGCAYARLKRWKDAKEAFETAIRLLGNDAPQYLHRYLNEVIEAQKQQ
ncbi:MAG: tetratricopeptide repeat protein [Armatimonadota bacterium]|nr:tetratricopeptide repeat protein [Armatimonadota bacterium]MCX7778228.1 tetratricopeptide repeat protein [Armatimonadota bacterium]MDW8024494.1 tetratricopeptide repeat protein [Armatimonadota bacterium]